MSPVVIAAAIGFVVVSAVIGSVLAGAGGWRALAARYPLSRSDAHDEEQHRFASLKTAGGAIGTATYRSVVTIGLGPRGISLSLWAPFAMNHPPIFLPWEAVEHYRMLEVYGNRWTTLRIRGGESITVYGRPAAAIATGAEAAAIPLTPLGPAV
jgi:hypothetical protein